MIMVFSSILRPFYTWIQNINIQKQNINTQIQNISTQIRNISTQTQIWPGRRGGCRRGRSQSWGRGFPPCWRHHFHFFVNHYSLQPFLCEQLWYFNLISGFKLMKTRRPPAETEVAASMRRKWKDIDSILLELFFLISTEREWNKGSHSRSFFNIVQTGGGAGQTHVEEFMLQIW